jgi:exonuclease VII large subunit
MAKKVKGFEDYNIEAEKEKLQKIKRSFVPNSDQQQFTTNTRNEFDEKTRKITAVTKDEVEDKLDHIKKFSEEFDWDEVLNKNREEGEMDEWDALEKDMMAIADKYSGKFGPDSYGVADAMHQVLDGMFQKK